MSQEDETLIKNFVNLLRRHLLFFLLLAIAGGGAGFALSYLFAPVFRAEALLVASDEVLGLNQNAVLGGIGGLASLVGMSGVGSRESEALAVLKSRALTTSFIESNHLLPILFRDRWDVDARKWNVDKQGKAPSMEDAYKRFDANVRSVIENRKTGLITVSITWKDPALAKIWVEGLVRAANDYLRSQAIERSTNNLDFLKKELDRTSIVAVKDTISKLMETEIKKQMMATGNRDYAFRVVDPAVVPEHKVFPKRWIFLALGSFLGCLIWLLVVAFKSPRGQREPV